MAATQLLWFGVGLVAMLAIASAFATTGSCATTSTRGRRSPSACWPRRCVLGYEVNGARLWIDLGPVSVQPGELLKIVLVIFIAAYLAETRTLLTSARIRIGFLELPTAALLPAHARAVRRS